MILKTAIVIPDQHFPIHDQQAVNCALQILEIAKPDIFINLGDVGEWETVSAWRWRDKKQPPLEYQLPLIDEEIEAVNDGIDPHMQGRGLRPLPHDYATTSTGRGSHPCYRVRSCPC